MNCAHSFYAAQSSLFWPVCLILLFVVIIAAIDGRKHRIALRAAKNRAIRLERRLRIETEFEIGRPAATRPAYRPLPLD